VLLVENIGNDNAINLNDQLVRYRIIGAIGIHVAGGLNENNAIYFHKRFMEEFKLWRKTYVKLQTNYPVCYKKKWCSNPDFCEVQEPLSNGDRYWGKKYNGKGYCGPSAFQNLSGQVYEGSFLDGKYHGTGKLVYKTGEIYEGEFLHGFRTGDCVFKMSNGDVYDGKVVNGMFNGKGKLFRANEWVYEGDFINSKMSGDGILKYHNGNIYEGKFYDGKRQGRGKFTKPNGDVTIGEWLEDSIVKYY